MIIDPFKAPKKTVDDELRDALYAFDTKTVLRALKRGANPNGLIVTSNSWLSVSAALRDIRERDMQKLNIVSLLTYAIDRFVYVVNNTEVIDHLIAFGADPNILNPDSTRGKFLSAMHALMYSRDEPIGSMTSQENFEVERSRILLQLLEAGANHNPINKKGENFLHVSAYSANLTRMKWLSSVPEFKLHFKDMINAKDISGRTPICRLSESLSFLDYDPAIWNMYSFLVNHGSEINTRISNDDKRTIEDLFLAAKKTEVWRKLIALHLSIKNQPQESLRAKPRL